MISFCPCSQEQFLLYTCITFAAEMSDCFGREAYEQCYPQITSKSAHLYLIKFRSISMGGKLQPQKKALI